MTLQSFELWGMFLLKRIFYQLISHIYTGYNTSLWYLSLTETPAGQIRQCSWMKLFWTHPDFILCAVAFTCFEWFQSCSCFPPQNNYLAFTAELFWWFEVVKPSFVEPRKLDTEGTGKCEILTLQLYLYSIFQRDKNSDIKAYMIEQRCIINHMVRRSFQHTQFQ